jgi:predicted Rossmann fold flavoprotein
VANDDWDIVVVGAGAAGLMAALRAAELGRRVLILEKNKKPGVKILMSGGTRCNITHATDERGIVEEYGPPGRFLHSALAAFTVQDTLDFFQAEGVATKVEETGKIFPVSNRAADVLDALVRRLHRSGAILSLESPLRKLNQSPNGFVLETANYVCRASRVILTTGGKSYPGSGTTGDGYGFTSLFGHAIVPPRPALVPIIVDVPWVAELRGLTLPDVAVHVMEADRVLAGRRGALLFAHFGLTGPVILDVSRVVSGHTQPKGLALEIDLLPAMKASDLEEWLRTETAAAGKKQLAALISVHLPRRLADIILKQAKLPMDRKAAALRKTERSLLVDGIKHLRVPIAGTLGFGKAEVTAGGVALHQVDSRTMESKLTRNLYIAGELLDLDGPIGGYNFQVAWSTGWLAGSAAARVSRHEGRNFGAAPGSNS